MLPSEQLCKGRQRQGAHLDTATGVRPSRGTATFELRRDLAKPREPTPTELLRPGTLHLTRILFRRGNRAQTPEGCHVYRLRSQVDCFCFSAVRRTTLRLISTTATTVHAAWPSLERAAEKQKRMIRWRRLL